MDNDDDIKDVRKKLQGKVASPSKLSPTEVLLKAAAYRLISRETFEAVRNRKIRGRTHKTTKSAFASLVWPETPEEVPVAPKRKRPDLAKRLVESKNKKFDVVACSWRRVCKDDTWELLTPVLNTIMDRLNQVTMEAYELANYHVIRCLSEGVPVQPLDKTFFYRCCNAVCVDRKGSRVVVEEDASLDLSAERFHGWRRNVRRSAACKSGLRAPFQVLSGDMATACDNMFDATFFRRFRNWVRRTIDCSGKYATKIVSLVIGDQKTEQTKDVFVLRLRSRLPHRTEISSSNKHLFMPLLRLFQRSCDGRRQSLLPHKKGFKPHMLTINNNTLRMLLIESKVEGIPSEAEFLKRSDEWWSKLFRIQKFETKNRFFTNEIVTDGKSARLVMFRMVKGASKKDKKKDDSSYRVPLVDWSHVKEVRSIDPGKRAMATSAGVGFVEQSPSLLPILRFSSKQFYNDARYVKTRRKEAFWKSNDQDVIKAENDLTHTLRNYDNLRDAEGRMIGMWRAMDVLVPFYSTHRFKNTRLNRFVGAKKALSAIVAKMTGGRSDKGSTVIGIGDWGAKSTGIKGCPGGPHRKLERGLEKAASVFKVDEKYTSKTCWCCHQQAMRNMTTKNQTGRRVKVHGVLHCQSSDCKGKTWDRDHNGALNILEIAMCLLRGWERPSCYRDLSNPETEDVACPLGNSKKMSRRTKKKPSMRSRS